ncbi:hypothetical protein TQ38_019840 [Novosphingobium sp. P6W]|nr:hypothetical protein TQ38_019840 [Novosphingobium sp. P6W]
MHTEGWQTDARTTTVSAFLVVQKLHAFLSGSDVCAGKRARIFNHKTFVMIDARQGAGPSL